MSRVAADPRVLFHALMHPPEPPEVLSAAEDLLADLMRQADREETANLPPLPQNLSPAQARNVLRHGSPPALVEFAWLRGSAQACRAHTETAAKLFSIYLTAFDARIQHRARLALALPDLPDPRCRLFCQDPEITDAAFLSAAARLALGFSFHLFPGEIIGFTLASLEGESPAQQLQKLAVNALHLPLHASGSLLEEGRSAAEIFLDQASESVDLNDRERRLRRGRALHTMVDGMLFQATMEGLKEEIADTVAKMLARKAPCARKHHGGLAAQGMFLDRRFAEEPFQAEAFMVQLARSPYVDTGRPEASRLIRAVDFGGPMFGVFSAEERRLLLAWLKTGAPAPTEPKTAPPVVRPTPAGNPVSEAIPPRRTLFHQLINSDEHPEVIGPARRLVEKYLRRARLEIYRRHKRSLQYFVYDPAVLEARVHDIYHAELERYRPFAASPKLSREAYRFGIEQLAPAVLVDGCWLQNVAPTPGDPVARRLFRILADEIGNGRPERNHANVYRALLAKSRIELPPPASPEFAGHPRFLDRAFDLPNYLLAISLFPETLRPELLGLNLGIELSGLGGLYLRLAEEMAHWGFDPTIVRLHISIDNLESGHAALALEAVMMHMEKVRETGGALDDQWKRILAGYHSLRTVPRLFALQMVLSYLLRRYLPARLGGNIASEVGS